MKLVIMVLALAILLLVPTLHKEQTEASVSFKTLFVPLQCYVGRLNIFEGIMKVPFEVAVIIFKDGTVYSFTNQLETQIRFPNLTEFFKTEGREIKDIVIVCHNHSNSNKFSVPDKNLYHMLVSEGFKGHYLIYYPATKSVLFYE